MSTEQNQPNSIPNEADEQNSRQENPQQNHTPGAASQGAGGATEVTQGNMGDGSGQRGGYGDSDQTNGMEGQNSNPSTLGSDEEANKRS
ncbi:hypothetical protein D3Y59_12930 [Hymenobacter oligotrophus]|uniref:Uncharacterized protein n=1 Tax=Hymenobacter oligotrophus TaxID=2319843 RepID=A0A3B7RU81_9BACT|nr:hypothetical protein [Hymenobacter oligotrophus]AYA37867.1 hypothetical protein D3Y59_12930 [Hymenobacter oligotrophus]